MRKHGKLQMVRLMIVDELDRGGSILVMCPRRSDFGRYVTPEIIAATERNPESKLTLRSLPTVVLDKPSCTIIEDFPIE